MALIVCAFPNSMNTELVAVDYDQGSDTTSLRLAMGYAQLACDASDPGNNGCCGADVKALYLALNTTAVQVWKGEAEWGRLQVYGATLLHFS